MVTGKGSAQSLKGILRYPPPLAQNMGVIVYDY